MKPLTTSPNKMWLNYILWSTRGGWRNGSRQPPEAHARQAGAATPSWPLHAGATAFAGGEGQAISFSPRAASSSRPPPCRPCIKELIRWLLPLLALIDDKWAQTVHVLCVSPHQGPSAMAENCSLLFLPLLDGGYRKRKWGKHLILFVENIL